MKRQKFILLASLGTVSIVIPSYLKYKNNIESLLKLPLDLTYIHSLSSIIFLGRAYLNKFPLERNTEELSKLLSENYANGLDFTVKNDYEKNNTVVLDGWILSRTEARQCALLSLLQPRKY